MKEKLVEIIKYRDDRLEIRHWDSYNGNDLIFEVHDDKIFNVEYFEDSNEPQLKEVNLIEMLNLILDNNG